MFSWAQSWSNSTYICGAQNKRDPWVFHASHCVASADCGSPAHAAVIMLTVGKIKHFRKNGTFGQSCLGQGGYTHVSSMLCSIFMLFFKCHHTCPGTPLKLPVSRVVAVKLLSCHQWRGTCLAPTHLLPAAEPTRISVSVSEWMHWCYPSPFTPQRSETLLFRCCTRVLCCVGGD